MEGIIDKLTSILQCHWGTGLCIMATDGHKLRQLVEGTSFVLIINDEYIRFKNKDRSIVLDLFKSKDNSYLKLSSTHFSDVMAFVANAKFVLKRIELKYTYSKLLSILTKYKDTKDQVSKNMMTMIVNSQSLTLDQIIELNKLGFITTDKIESYIGDHVRDKTTIAALIKSWPTSLTEEILTQTLTTKISYSDDMTHVEYALEHINALADGS